MDDLQIIELYFNRSEEAISETAKKYGTYCYVIANNILHSEPDAEECVNDTYLRAWNAIPPARPTRFSAFLAKITRNLAFNRYASLHAQKRCGEAEIALEELSEVLSDPNAEIEHSENDALKDAINRFLGLLSHDARVIFIRRYFYLLSVSEIAKGMNASETRIKVSLHRTREKLKVFLEKEGITL